MNEKMHLLEIIKTNKISIKNSITLHNKKKEWFYGWLVEWLDVIIMN